MPAFFTNDIRAKEKCPQFFQKEDRYLDRNYCAVLEKYVLPSIEMTRIPVPMPTLLLMHWHLRTYKPTYESTLMSH